MKKFFILSIFLIALLSFGAAAKTYYFYNNVQAGQIRFIDDVVESGQELEMHINVNNRCDRDDRDCDDIENVKVMAYIPETGDMIYGSHIDLDEGESKGKFLFYDLPTDYKGELLVRLSISNDDIRVVKYRYITIV